MRQRFAGRATSSEYLVLSAPSPPHRLAANEGRKVFRRVGFRIAAGHVQVSVLLRNPLELVAPRRVMGGEQAGARPEGIGGSSACAVTGGFVARRSGPIGILAEARE